MENTQNPSFLYDPLPTPRSIRLIKLSSTSSSVSCQLIPATLDDPDVTYEALSYVWGDPTDTIPIQLNGKEFHATKNLECALRHLRKSDGDRILWIDAICINQMDLEERSRQVGMMKDIYQHCQTCLMWLGEDYRSGLISRGMEVCKTLRTTDFKLIDLKDKTLIHNNNKNGDEVDYRDLRPLRSFLDRPAIWTRVWIMQEASLAPKVLLIAGNHQLEWEVLEMFLSSDYLPDAFHKTSSHGSGPTSEIFNYPQVIHYQRLLMQGMKKGQQARLLDVVARFRPTRATDPRDKIYGLLGLSNNTLGIEPNYKKEVWQVYSEFTEKQINEDGNLDMLCQSQWAFGNRSEPALKLPSWVPDFSNTWFHQLLFAQRGIFCAGKRNCRTPCRVNGGEELMVKGVRVGVVKDVKGPAWDEVPKEWIEDPMIDTKEKLFELWIPDDFEIHTQHGVVTSTRKADDTRAPITELNGFEAYWRTMMTDCTRYPIKRLSSSELKIQKELVEGWREGKEEHWDKITGKIMNLRDWRFAILSSGLYSLIRKDVQNGDIVVVLDGGKVPVALRASSMEKDQLATKNDGLKRYQLVGPVYVHGLMDGEANTWVETGKLGLEGREFVLL